MNYRRYRKRYRPYRSSLRKRARGNQRAANQQRDSTNVIVNTNYSFACGQTMDDPFGNNNIDDFVDSGCAAINIYDVLRKSDYFNQFSTLYDQFKIDNIRAKIVATNWVTSKDNDNSTDRVNENVRSKSYVIVTAWDRSGLSPSQIKIKEWTNDPKTHIFTTNIGKSITSYGSAKTKHLGPGNAYEIVRQLYPENAYERSQYISTKLLVPQQTRLNNEDFTYNCYYYRKLNPPVNGENKQAIAYKWESKYPTNLMNDPSCPFKPTLLVNVIAGPEPQVVEINEKDPEGFESVYYLGVNKVKPVTFDIEFDISVTFRGLRYNKFTSIPIIKPEIIPTPLFAIPANIPDSRNDRGPKQNTNIASVFVSDSVVNPKGRNLDVPFANANGGKAITFKKPKTGENNLLVYIDSTDKVLYVKKIEIPEGQNSTSITLVNNMILLDYLTCKDNDYINLDFMKVIEGTEGEDESFESVYDCSIPCQQGTWFLNSFMQFAFRNPDQDGGETDSDDFDDDMEYYANNPDEIPIDDQDMFDGDQDQVAATSNTNTTTNTNEDQGTTTTTSSTYRPRRR